MLVLSRKQSQRVFLDLPDGTRIAVTLVEIQGPKVRLGFEAPPCVRITREELEQEASRAQSPPAAT